ncbi:MAG: CehA/McbA family metallohydrolase, partial [Myxococcota bacterium]
EAEHHGKKPMDFLSDLSLGEHRRHTDLSWRNPAVEVGRLFIEEVLYTGNGIAHGVVRPSCLGERCRDYDVYVSRGPEYDLWVRGGLRFEPGQRRELDVILHRMVDTTDWVSTDLHVHSINSADSFLALDDRVISAAAEGLEMPVSTDHNYVTDYRPTIASLGLHDWMTTAIGVELTTLEMGHFNGFPLRYDLGSASHFPYVETCETRDADKVNRTSFDWVQCKPDELFDNLRRLGRFGSQNTIVQVTHPRDTILGYFNQYFLNPYTQVAEAPTGENADNYPEAILYLAGRPGHSLGQFDPESFSWNFDAIEVFSGKRLDMLHAFKIADDTPQADIDRLRDPCQGGHPENGLDEDGHGKVRLRQGGHIAFPGTIDDWMRMLNKGFQFTATGNSDSHKLSSEIGAPRTYVWVQPTEDGFARDLPPTAVTELDLVDALKAHRAIVTNGPFLDMNVVTDAADELGNVSGDKIVWPMGSTVHWACNADAAGECQGNIGREVQVLLSLKTAPWITVDEIVMYKNGKVLERIPIARGKYTDGDCAGRDFDDCDLLRRSGPTYTFDRDVYLVAEVRGSQSMFPVVAPKEEPPSNIADALGGLAGSLGLDIASFGDGVTAPTYIQKVTPFALTNPIWLDIDGNGEWNPPGNADVGPGPAEEPRDGCPEIAEIRVRPDAPVLQYLFAPPIHGGRHYIRADIRKIFHGHHPH